jgi:hypothetical protein
MTLLQYVIMIVILHMIKKMFIPAKQENPKLYLQ